MNMYVDKPIVTTKKEPQAIIEFEIYKGSRKKGFSTSSPTTKGLTPLPHPFDLSGHPFFRNIFLEVTMYNGL